MLEVGSASHEHGTYISHVRILLHGSGPYYSCLEQYNHEPCTLPMSIPLLRPQAEHRADNLSGFLTQTPGGRRRLPFNRVPMEALTDMIDARRSRIRMTDL